MPGGLDHIVHAVRDLDAAAAAYRGLGFTVGARNRHPWGTHNVIVQLPGFFVELLTIGEPEKITQPAGRQFSFGAFTREFLAGCEGFSMLVLESRDAAADAAGYERFGFGGFDVFDFEREGRRPDGAAVKLAFSLAFAIDPKSPSSGFFACQQHFPENFWNPAFQAHRNTASGVAGVVLVAENPSDHHIFLSAYTGLRDLRATSSGVAVTTPRGEIQIMDPAAFHLRFGVEPPADAAGARIAALRIAVRDMAMLGTVLRESGVAIESRMGAVIVRPQDAMGATIVFEPA